jgi:uncharacterized membrane protein YtjA (UPF0391 family)
LNHAQTAPARVLQTPDETAAGIVHPVVPTRASRGKGLARVLESKGAPRKKEVVMIYWALIFLIIAIVAGVLGLSGVAGAATNIAWILFVVGLVVALVFLITGRSPRV